MTSVSELKNFFPVAESIARLLHPYAEVVVHNVRSNKIAAIFNSFSKRKAGDGSLLGKEEEFIEHADICGPYEKMNWDGTKLKSISSVIRDSKGKIMGLLCINLNISSFEKCKSLIEAFIAQSAIGKKPAVLFKDDWHERINEYIHHYLAKRHLNLTSLTAKHKKQLITHLYQQGAFDGKNAANYIAQILKVSRATVYNYLQVEAMK